MHGDLGGDRPGRDRGPTGLRRPLVGLCEALEVNQPEPRDGGDEIRRRFEGLTRDLASAQGVRGLHLVVPGGDPA